MLEDFDCITIVAVQPILRAHPEAATAILKNSQPGILREAILDRKVLKLDNTARCKAQIKGYRSFCQQAATAGENKKINKVLLRSQEGILLVS